MIQTRYALQLQTKSIAEYFYNLFYENHVWKCATLNYILFHYQSTRCASHGDRKRKDRKSMSYTACSMLYLSRTCQTWETQKQNKHESRESMVFVSAFNVLSRKSWHQMSKWAARMRHLQSDNGTIAHALNSHTQFVFLTIKIYSSRFSCLQFNLMKCIRDVAMTGACEN